MFEILGTLIMGAFVGWLAGNIMGDKGSLIRNIVVGIVGSAIGSFLCSLMGILAYGFIAGLIADVVGACVLLWLVHVLFKKR